MEDAIYESLDCFKENLEFTLGKFTFHLLFDSSFDGLYCLGSALRGGFGIILKRLFALMKKESVSCAFQRIAVHMHISSRHLGLIL